MKDLLPNDISHSARIRLSAIWNNPQFTSPVLIAVPLVELTSEDQQQNCKNQTPSRNQKVKNQKNSPADPVAVAKIKWKQQ